MNGDILTDFNIGLGSGEIKTKGAKYMSDLLGDDADFIFSTKSRYLKPKLPDYVIEAMKKAGKRSLNVDGKEVNMW